MLNIKNDIYVVKRTSAALKDDEETKMRQTNIAEAAYFIAEKRGFLAGHEIDDWLEAEKEIMNK